MMRNLLEITLRIRNGLMYQLTIVLLHIQYKNNKNVKFLFFSGEQQKSVSIQTLTKISQGRLYILLASRAESSKPIHL